MAFQIIWTLDGIHSFNKVLEYLELNFTDKEINRFVEKVNYKLMLALSNPNMHRRSRKFNNVHYKIVLDRVLLVYRVKPIKQTIEILYLWDARQNPKKFKY